MHTVQSPMTIADYASGMDRGELSIDNNYQRSDKVWPPAAKSFLIETILLGYPLPKIFLFQRTDLKSKKTIKEIVDGQQRSRAIHDFFHNKLSISKKSEIVSAAGKRYDQLDENLQGAFLNYQLSIDLFVSATPAEIRQAFRRLNSYTVPLNPEELRHAEYQGSFKWFIYQLTEDYDEAMLELGVLGSKQLVRMQDAKLWTEIVHSVIYGIKTTKAKDLNAIYKAFDKEFDRKDEMSERAKSIIVFLLDLPEIHKGVLMKPHIFYSLALAVTQYVNPCETLDDIFEVDENGRFDRDIAATNLTRLANAIEADDPMEYSEFAKACSEKTNVDTQRLVRVRWLGRALQPILL